MITRRHIGSVVVGFLFSLSPREVSAHHGFGGRYDGSRPVFISGPIRRASFSPPHPVIEIDVPAGAAVVPSDPAIRALGVTPAVRDTDRGRRLVIEFPPVRLFFSLAEQIRVGDVVEVVALVNCEPPHQLRGQWLRLADGREVVRTGRMQAEVSGCR